jgi:hypothetical protein
VIAREHNDQNLCFSKIIQAAARSAIVIHVRIRSRKIERWGMNAQLEHF